MKAATAYLAALSVAAAVGLAQAAVAAGPAPTLAGMRVHLLENSSGKLSEADALDPQHGSLWNTIASPHASNAALVLVQIAGPPSAVYSGYFGPNTKFSVRLVAKESGRVKPLLDQTLAIPLLTEQGKTTVGFLIHPGGCKPVQLVASIVGVRSAAPAAPVEALLPFACGE